MPTLRQAKTRARQLRLAVRKVKLNRENRPESQVDDEASFFSQSADAIDAAIKAGEFKSKPKKRINIRSGPFSASAERR